MAERLLPEPTPDTQTFWDKAQDHELWLPRWEACSRVIFYPRSFCPYCGWEEVRWFRTSGRGVVESFIINSVPGPGYEDQVPYAIAYVRLDEGVRLVSNLREVEQTPEAITVGMRVEVDFEERGQMSIPQFRPVADDEEDAP